MPAVNGVGEPCAGEPHARFEVAGAGNGADLTKGAGVAQPAGKPAEERPQALPSASHRASPRPYSAFGPVNPRRWSSAYRIYRSLR